MSLELVTGPANAEKAGVVLDRTRMLATAGADPILVVPTRPDVLAFRRELAADGLVFGVRVETFSGLSREIAARTGRPAGGASAVVRLRVAEAAIAAHPARWRSRRRRRRRASSRRSAALCAELDGGPDRAGALVHGRARLG